QKLLELYSPDLVTAQRELLYLLEADRTNTPLIASARQKLRLLGLTDGQIDETIKRRQPSYSLAVFSPYDGYVVEGSSAPAPAMPAPSGGGTSAGGMTGGGMGGSGTDEVVFSAAPSAPASSAVADGALPIREGQYVQTGQTLFQVVNPTRLWAEFRLYAQDAARLKPGSPLTISFSGSGTPIQRARVDFVVPFFASGNTDAASQFVTIRAYLSGANGPRVGQLAKATLRQPVPNALWIPATAVLELGTERVAFVKEGGAFRPVRVQTGAQSGTLVAVMRGLTEGQAIARNAQFLIDSESFVNVTQTTP
ncbi:efflux RND transporter periplasmic adaptor subunit, partial [Fibrella sp. WM1]|uniref:efflux RND transporter periplasmic adaptor subunit n=1 Tax=Fibrella musci TaxID=3242485 RepID=UPI0035202EDF